MTKILQKNVEILLDCFSVFLLLSFFWLAILQSYSLANVFDHIRIVLFVLTMKRQISHMTKYRYLPFDFGKKRYTGKKFTASGSGSSKD